MDLLKGTFTTVNCPSCLYGMDVELISVLLEQIVFCPCCKSAVQLADADASTYGAQKGIELAVEEFGRELKKLNKTFRFKV